MTESRPDRTKEPKPVTLIPVSKEVMAIASRRAAQLGKLTGLDPQEIMKGLSPVLLAETRPGSITRVARHIGMNGLDTANTVEKLGARLREAQQDQRKANPVPPNARR